MTAAENQINEVTRNASRRPSAIEVDRGMNVSMNLYDLVIRDEVNSVSRKLLIPRLLFRTRLPSCVAMSPWIIILLICQSTVQEIDLNVLLY